MAPIGWEAISYRESSNILFTDETCSQVRHERPKSRRTFLSVTAAVCFLRVIIKQATLPESAEYPESWISERNAFLVSVHLWVRLGFTVIF